MQFGHVKLQSMRDHKICIEAWEDRRGFDWKMIQLLTEQRSPLETMYSSTPKGPLQHKLRSLGESWGAFSHIGINLVRN